MGKRLLAVLMLMAVCVSATAQIASMPRRYTPGDFPTGQDLQANFEWIVDLVNQASEAVDIATITARLNGLDSSVATITDALATLTADVTAGGDYLASYSSNVGSTSAELIWDTNGLTYANPITGQGAIKFSADIVYIGVNYYGGYTITGAMASSPGSGSYWIGGPVTEYFHEPSATTSGISIVASHSADGGGGLRFKLIASFPSSILFKANARVKFAGATF